MTLSLIHNQNFYIVFEADSAAIQCNSRELESQVAFIISALERYKQITFVRSPSHIKPIQKINKHYKISENSVTIQRSFLKFFRERLEEIEEKSLTYQSIISCLD